MKNISRILWPIVLCGILLAFGTGIGNTILANDNEMKWTVKWQGFDYSGIYKGETRNNKPNGYGEFEGEAFLDGKTYNSIIYKGNWKNGSFHGEGRLSDRLDNVSYEGKFQENTLNGSIKIYADGEDTYVLRKYKKDVPYNVSWECTEDGKYIACDRFFCGISVNLIQKEAKELDYQMMLYHPEQLMYQKMKLDCVVNDYIDSLKIEKQKTILYRNILVSDKNGNTYLLKCNMSYAGTATNYMPVLEAGDRVTVYGYYAGIETFKDGSVKYPCMEAIAADIDNNFDPQNMKYQYKDFLNYPYEYKDKEIQLNGTVIGVHKITEEWIYFLVESDSYSAEKEYYICRTTNTAEEAKKIPSPGNPITLQGILKLNSYYKIDKYHYNFCPRVEWTNNGR